MPFFSLVPLVILLTTGTLNLLPYVGIYQRPDLIPVFLATICSQYNEKYVMVFPKLFNYFPNVFGIVFSDYDMKK